MLGNLKKIINDSNHTLGYISYDQKIKQMLSIYDQRLELIIKYMNEYRLNQSDFQNFRKLTRI